MKFTSVLLQQDFNEVGELWELHEIRHRLAKEMENKTIDEINRDALKKWEEWKREYGAGQKLQFVKILKSKIILKNNTDRAKMIKYMILIKNE